MFVFELIVGGVAGLFGHRKSKDFVRRRLRYTGVVEKSSVRMGLVAGAATAVVAVPVAGVLPVVGAGAALITAAGVGSGVALGVMQARKGGMPDDRS